MPTPSAHPTNLIRGLALQHSVGKPTKTFVDRAKTFVDRAPHLSEGTPARNLVGAAYQTLVGTTNALSGARSRQHLRETPHCGSVTTPGRKKPQLPHFLRSPITPATHPGKISDIGELRPAYATAVQGFTIPSTAALDTSRFTTPPTRFPSKVEATDPLPLKPQLFGPSLLPSTAPTAIGTPKIDKHHHLTLYNEKKTSERKKSQDPISW